MKAAVMQQPGEPLVIATLPDPEPAPGEVVIQVQRCGICGTDLHKTASHKFRFKPGTVLGHEYAGEIVAIGAGVSGHRIGDLVTAMPVAHCGECRACLQGNRALCDHAHPVAGGYGEYMRIPTGSLVPLPAGLSVADGALVEPLAVGLHGVRVADIQVGDRVLVIGAGAVALNAIFWARRLGAGRIVAMSRAQRRAGMALAMGADAFIPYGENEIGEVAEALGGQPDIVFECVGNPGFVQKGIEHVRKFGQVVSMGFCMEPDSFMQAGAGMKAVTLRFAIGWTMPEFHFSVDALSAGTIDPKMMISSVVPLDQVPQIFETLRGPNNETKVHVSPFGR